MNAPHVRRLVALLKVAFATVILALLAWHAQRNDAFAQLADRPLNWGLLAAGLLTTVVAVLLSFVRWYLVTRAAGIGLPLGEALRYGAMAFALTFVGPGAVGGDVLKMVAVARGRQGRRTAAATTVLVDRVLGLLALMLTASAAILVFRAAGAAPTGAVWVTCQTTLALTAVAVLGAALLFVPGVANDALADRLERAPLVGGPLAQIIHAWKDYQRHAGLLAGALCLSLFVDVLLVLSFYCVAVGLPLQAPTLVQHFFIVPLNLISAAIPITPGGVGVREGVADLLYQGFGVPPGQGTLIAAGHSLMMLAAGGVAVLYYLAERSRCGAPAEDPPVADPTATT